LKVRRAAVLGLLISISFASGAFAASNLEKVEAFLRRDYTVYVNGTKADVGPVLIYNNSSYLPLAKIGSLLGADVNWNAANQGIYVNPRFAGQPDPVKPSNPDYTPITMVQPQGYKVTYLGLESPVLAITASDYKTYYRNNDILRLGINTDGLHLAQETKTKEIYISDAELAKVTKEKPEFTYVYEKFVVGENDPDKLKVVQKFIDGLPMMYKAMNMKDPLNPNADYYTVPYIYVIDALPNDEYNILGLENYNFKRYWLKLKKNVLGDWFQAENKITDLGTNFPQY